MRVEIDTSTQSAQLVWMEYITSVAARVYTYGTRKNDSFQTNYFASVSMDRMSSNVVKTSAHDADMQIHSMKDID